MRSVFLTMMTVVLLPGVVHAATIDFAAPDRVWLEEFTRPVQGKQPGCGWDFACFRQSGYEFGTSFYMDAPGISLDDDGGGLDSTTVNRTDGKRFSVKSVEIDTADGGAGTFQAGPGANPIPYDIEDGAYWDAADTPEYNDWARGDYDGILYGVYGYRDGSKVAAKEFGAMAPGTLLLDDSFTSLDHLQFSIVLPASLVSRREGLPAYKEVWIDGKLTWAPLAAGDVWCADYCTVFGISGMTAVESEADPSPVPLPATMPLMAAALGFIALLRQGARWTSRRARLDHT